MTPHDFYSSSLHENLSNVFFNERPCINLVLERKMKSETVQSNTDVPVRNGISLVYINISSRISLVYIIIISRISFQGSSRV